MADPRKALFLANRPIGYVDGKPVDSSPDFIAGLQHITILVGGSQGILPESIANGAANGLVYVGTDGSLQSTTALTNGQVLIGRTGSSPLPATLTGTSNQVTVTNASGSITLSTPQNTHTAATPTFAGLTISGQTANTVYAGPTSGGAGNATFRAVVAADLGGLAGTYTPTLSNTTNVAASTSFQWQYLRVGNTVTASGPVDVDPTAAGQVVLGISLPIASNFGADEDCSGVGAAIDVASQSAGIHADVANNRATLEWIAVDTANRRMYCTMTYQVI